MRIVWFTLRTENGRKFRLHFPISCLVFQELLDSVLDLAMLICFFVPKTPNSVSRISVHTAKDLIRLLMGLFGSITEDGPYDLVAVSADNVQVSVKIR